jgi:hypothetical protein
MWTDEGIALIRKNFVAAAVPTWVCRAKTPEGEFLRKAGINKQWFTSSGYFSCITADCTFLGYEANAKTLAAFNALPAERRKPGAIEVPELKPEERLVPTPPRGGLVVRVHGRFLSEAGGGEWRYAQSEDFPLMGKTDRERKTWKLFLQPNTEYLWLTEAEWRALVPGKARKGLTVRVPPILAERLARFHLTPRRAMTSEGGILPPRDVRKANLDLVVEEVTANRLTLRRSGLVQTGIPFAADKATTPNGPLGFGFETPLEGILEYDRVADRFTRMDILALGQVWGRWGNANGKLCHPSAREHGVALFRLAELDPATSYSGCYIRTLAVEALYAAFARAELSNTGIPRVDPIATKLWGLREFALVDHDGNLLRVGQPIQAGD